MQNRQIVPLFVILIILIITAGCNGAASHQQPAPAALVTTMITVNATPTNPIILPVVSTVTTAVPTVTASRVPTTLSINTGALDAPVHLKSKKPGHATFTTVRPGKVDIHVYCMWPGTAILSSATMKDVILFDKRGYIDMKPNYTVNLVTPQEYRITFSGFREADIGTQTMWDMDVINA
jgi:hypothetical protein